MTHASQFRTRQSWKPDLTSNRKADKTTLLLLSLRLSALSAPQHGPQQVGHSRSPEGLFFRRTDVAQRPGWPPCAQSRGQTRCGGWFARLRRGRAVKCSSTLPPTLLFQLKFSPTPENCLPAPNGATPPPGRGHVAHRRAFPQRPSNIRHGFPAPTPRGRKPCLRHTAGTRRSNPRTQGDSIVH